MTNEGNAAGAYRRDPMKRILQQNRQKRALERERQLRDELIENLAGFLKCSREDAETYAKRNRMIP